MRGGKVDHGEGGPEVFTQAGRYSLFSEVGKLV